MRSINPPFMLAQELPLGRNDKPVRVDTEADGPVRERRRDAVTVALEVDQAGWRDPLALLDEPVEGGRHRH